MHDDYCFTLPSCLSFGVNVLRFIGSKIGLLPAYFSIFASPAAGGRDVDVGEGRGYEPSPVTLNAG